MRKKKLKLKDLLKILIEYKKSENLDILILYLNKVTFILFLLIFWRSSIELVERLKTRLTLLYFKTLNVAYRIGLS